MAVVFRGERVLAMRRGPSKQGAGLWETLSGRVEPGEEPLAAVRREVVEESGLQVRVEPRPVDAYAAHRGDTPMVVVVYRADWLDGEVRRSAEHDDHAWWTWSELQRHLALPRLLEAIRRAWH